MKDKLRLFVKSIVNSYSAIFFSRSNWFGLLLIALTMLYPIQGICGLFCCMLVNAISILLNLDRYKTETGLYGFNAVLVGIALGAFFTYNVVIVGLIFALSILVLLLTITLDGWLQKYGLPYLAFPFLFCLWIVLLVFQQTDGFVGTDIFLLASQHSLSVGPFSVEAISSLPMWNYLPEPVLLYLRSIGFVFFQSDLLTGMILAVALLCFSRIAFFFSLFGFLVAYWAFDFLSFDIFHLPFIFFGFNFIFTALSLGGCYLVPSKTTFLWVVLLIPAQYLVIFSSTRLLAYFMLPTFSLAFCSVSVLFLYMLKRRETQTAPYFSYFLEATPENNIYYHLVNKDRFDYMNYQSFSLPFMGEWTVTQAYNGMYTHKGLWQHAFDFRLEFDGVQYNGNGFSLTDYFCYGKPVVAVASGEVVGVQNDVEDNLVGKENKEQNWGNYVLVKHADHLYSLVAHLKTGSIRCRVGDTVRKGDLLGLCGNSGLSPYPHLHFQFQSAPYVGAPTLEYKISSYLKKEKDGVYRPFLAGIPKENDVLVNMNYDDLMASRYKFLVGHLISTKSDKFGTETWNVCLEYGYYFFYCIETQAKAWFSYRDGDFCFQRYEGDEKSNLYYFFLSNYRVMFLSDTYEMKEELPLTIKAKNPLGYLQDFCAPFFTFMNYAYLILPTQDQNRIKTNVVKSVLGKKYTSYSFETLYESNKIASIKVSQPNRDTWNIQFQL